jgi:hypothetical protein
MKTAVIYARVSSKDQEREGFSIPAQLKLLRQYARTQGFRVKEEFVDEETAKVAGRKQFGEMVLFSAAPCMSDSVGGENGPAVPQFQGLHHAGGIGN